jgi:hypothetical protein
MRKKEGDKWVESDCGLQSFRHWSESDKACSCPLTKPADGSELLGLPSATNNSRWQSCDSACKTWA